ncbi:hypothetical protein [Raoultella planticola]|uniref:hypothetical protein n=1 Tax=Raoultella planticola TaxID=575 RepID=UPI001F534187|nr:hypothetical protein [Raoultella planticola]EIY2676438.1 hypothetical protein [Raoultella planticola]UNK75531.1 hypothetical protein MNO12_02815 [Raoultella planticola]
MHGDEILQNAAITRIIQHFAGKEIFLAPGSGEKQRRGGAGRHFFTRRVCKTATAVYPYPAHNHEGDNNMCTNLHDNARQYAEEKK